MDKSFVGEKEASLGQLGNNTSVRSLLPVMVVVDAGQTSFWVI